MQFATALFTLAALTSTIAGSPVSQNAKIDFFPTTCDKYACGWCHFYYDNKTAPDGTTSKCLKDDKWSSCPFCEKQPYCKGAPDCAP